MRLLVSRGAYNCRVQVGRCICPETLPLRLTRTPSGLAFQRVCFTAHQLGLPAKPAPSAGLLYKPDALESRICAAWLTTCATSSSGGDDLAEKDRGEGKYFEGTPLMAEKAEQPKAEPDAHGALYAELNSDSLSGPLSGRRLQRLAAAAAAQGIRDPRAWAALSARAIELNRSIGRASNHAAEDAILEPFAAKPGLNTVAQGGANAALQTTAKDSGAAAGFRHFEGLRFLSSFLSAGFKDTELLLSFEDIFLRQLQAFNCRHLLQLLHICEQYGCRARRLYVPLFRTLATQAPSLLFQEIADVFACFASHRVASSKCCFALLKAAAIQVPNASLSDCIKLCGAIHSLGMAGELRGSAVCGTEGSPALGTEEGATLVAKAEGKVAGATVLALIEQRVAFLAEGLPLQLLLDEVQLLPRLEFSWRPYEELAQRELMKRLAALGSAEDVEQLADPFATLQYLRAQGAVSEGFLKAMVRWCLSAAYKPATRSQKRPTAEELVLLHDACRERDMEDDERLQKAILKFVSNKGGTARHKRFVSPLEYQRNRRYYYLPDLRAGHTPAAS